MHNNTFDNNVYRLLSKNTKIRNNLWAVLLLMVYMKYLYTHSIIFGIQCSRAFSVIFTYFPRTKTNR